MGPRYLVRAAGLELHPIDQADRRRYLKDSGGIGYCNITKCCTEVCPEHIKITDNAIIPLKERVVDEFYDPIQWFWRKLRGRPEEASQPVELPVLHATGGTPTAVAEPDTTTAPEPVAKPPRTRRPRTATAPPMEPSGAVEPSGDGATTAKATKPARRTTGRSTRSS
jgi:succinate dehydrogenase / fumarate reductase, iron-sulfur subunit